MWCHVRHLNPKGSGKNPSRITKENKKIAKTLDYSGIEFPVSCKDYPVIEDRFMININVFTYNNGVFPYYVSDKGYDDHIELLFVSHECNEDVEGKSVVKIKQKPGKIDGQYVYIKDFNRSMYNKTKHSHKQHVCMNCLQHFLDDELLDKHKDNCLTVGSTKKIKMSDGETKCVNYSRQTPVPFNIYADFECILKKTDNINEIYFDDTKSSSEKYQDHIPCG